jgi:hypothetical protein
MKKREKVMLSLFVIDLFLLLFYKQVREGVRTTFTYEKIVFWWFYFYPIAYFLGGYFLSYFILAKSKIVLDKKVQKMLLVLIAAVAVVYVFGTGTMVIHQFLQFACHNNYVCLFYDISQTCLSIFNRRFSDSHMSV